MKKDIIKALGILAASLAIASSCYADETPDKYLNKSYDEEFNTCLEEHVVFNDEIFYYPGYYKKPIRHELESDAVAYYEGVKLVKVQENFKEDCTEEDVLRVVRLEAGKLEHEELKPETKPAPGGTTTIYTWKWKNNHEKLSPIYIRLLKDKEYYACNYDNAKLTQTTVEVTKLKSGKKMITMNHIYDCSW